MKYFLGKDGNRESEHKLLTAPAHFLKNRAAHWSKEIRLLPMGYLKNFKDYYGGKWLNILQRILIGNFLSWQKFKFLSFLGEFHNLNEVFLILSQI